MVTKIRRRRRRRSFEKLVLHPQPATATTIQPLCRTFPSPDDMASFLHTTSAAITLPPDLLRLSPLPPYNTLLGCETRPHLPRCWLHHCHHGASSPRTNSQARNCTKPHQQTVVHP
jgi:hypothetical protein